MRDALRDLSNHGYQIIFATHSALMIDPDDVPDTVMVTKTAQGGTTPRTTVRSAVKSKMDDNASQANALFTLTHSSQLLFADRAILAEGKTEQRLLPSLYLARHKQGFRIARIAMISIDGVRGLRKVVDILGALDIPSKAVVDLDFAFRGAVRSGFLDPTDTDLSASREQFRRLSSSHGFQLEDGSDLPVKGNGFAASDAFALFGADPMCKALTASLHSKLLAQRVWLWTLGSIEDHLGLPDKSEGTWAAFGARLKTSSLEDAVKDPLGVTSFLDWIGQP